MSEKSPKQVSEEGTVLYSEVKQADSERVEAEGIRDEIRTDLSEKQSKLDEVNEEIGQHGSEKVEIREENGVQFPVVSNLVAHRDAIESLKKDDIKDYSRFAAKAVKSQLKVESANRRASQHYGDNEGAYFDAALTDATLKGEQINVGTPEEQAASVETVQTKDQKVA